MVQGGKFRFVLQWRTSSCLVTHADLVRSSHRVFKFRICCQLEGTSFS